MILYHFSTSPFARRVRLVLAHKGLTAELRDSRTQPEHLPQLHALSPMHTVPVLVDGERCVVDSTAIVHYLDRKQPEPRLFPAGLDGALAFELAALAEHATFPKVRAEMVGRAQRSLQRISDLVEARGAPPVLCGETWSWADMVVLTLVSWLEGLPVRAQTLTAPRQIASLGWQLPAALSRWADQHRGRPDVLALD
jgi:glutathione S-transferase